MGEDIEDPEFAAMRQVYASLKDLDINAQNRVLDYVARRLSLARDVAEPDRPPAALRGAGEAAIEAAPSKQVDGSHETESVEGVSPIALKWMRRNELSGKTLSSLYSLGIEDIDLVAKSVPGKSNADRVRSVALLLGIAGYLSSGAARFADDKLREACGHYNAYDVANFSKHLKAIAALVSGTRENGYTLTSRGITDATNLIKSMTKEAQV